MLIRHTTGVANKAITLNAAIVASGGASVEAADTGGGGGVVTILNDSGTISVHNITSSGGVSGGGTAGNGGTIQLKTGVAGNTIAQAGSTSLIALAGTGAGTAGTDGNLKVISQGAVTLTNTGNDVGTLAASVADNAAAFSYTDASALKIGTVSADGTAPANLGSLSGIATKGGAVTVVAGTTTGSTLTLDQAINTTPSSAVNGGAVVLEAGGAITLQTSGTITTTGGTGGATGGVGGEVFIHHVGTTANAITLNKAITAKGGAGTTTGGNGAVVTLQNDNGTILINAGGAVDVSGGTGTTAGNGGTIQLVSAGTSAAITQTGTTTAEALLATGATGGSLKVSSSDTVTLQNQTNDVQTLAATISTAGKSFNYTDANALDIGTVAAAGSVSAPASPAGSGTSASRSSMSGITTAGGTGGDVKVVVLGTGSSGTLNVNQAINTTPSSAVNGGAVVLEAG
ncbi:MAG: hypothetical protein AAB150_07290, partial [Pseudomonadota bacterium]